MLTAQLKTGEIVQAKNADVSMKYYCPICKQLLILKSGDLRIKHFAHLNNCSLKDHEAETVEHLAGKIHLQQKFKLAGYNGNLEQYLPLLRQRPDLLLDLTSGKKLAIEYQCAPLTVEALCQRTQGYLTHGIQCWWILGENYWLKRKITQKIAQFMRWHPNLGFYLVYYFPKYRHFRLVYQIQQADFLKISYQQFITERLSVLQCFMRKSTVPNNISSSLRIIQQRNFERACCFYQGSLFEEQIAWYEKEINFRLLGIKLFEIASNLPIFAEKQLIWQSRILRMQDRRLFSEISFPVDKIAVWQLPLIKNQFFIKQTFDQFRNQILQTNFLENSCH